MTKELHTSRPELKRLPGEFSVLLARVVLFWERAWPAILPTLAPGFLLIIASLFDIWAKLPAAIHWIALSLTIAMSLAALWRYRHEIRWPCRRDGLARLEADGCVAHAPLQALEDEPFDSRQADSALWRAHIEDMQRRASSARLKPPRTTADARDPYGFRYTAVWVLIVALVAAGDDWRTRLSKTLEPGSVGSGSMSIVDLWIEPPSYTGMAPIYLLRAGEELAGVSKQKNTPEGSTVVAQVNGRGQTRLSLLTDKDEVPADVNSSGNVTRSTMMVSQSGVVRLRHGGREGRWPIGIIRDTSPTVAFIDLPSSTDDALVAFSVAVTDDYGLNELSVQFRLDPEQTLALDAPRLQDSSLKEVRTLVLNGAAGPTGARRFDIDLQADPWAGLAVYVKIVGKDGAGQTGETEEIAFKLPQRAFYNPLARAVVEQRRTLAVAAPSWQRVGRSFDALTLAPESFSEDATEYLLLRTAFWRVMRQDGEGFDDAVENFWPLALQLEDEALELARRRMEAAEEALRQALENDADDEEIARLVEDLRAAIQNYVHALAQSGQAMAQQQGQAEQIGQSDIDQMLDSIRNLSQSGANNAARQLLGDLENLLNNLRLAQGGSGAGAGQGASGSAGNGGAAGDAGDLIGRQRDLANRSFERGQTLGATGDDLSTEEGGIAGDLESLLDELGGDGQGFDPSGEATRELRDALDEMRTAEDALDADDFGAAASAMERAVENLRAGAGDLAREAMRQAGEAGAGEREGEAGSRRDPLGRPVGPEGAGGAYGDGADVPIDGAAGRARDVMEELRRRLGESGRSKEEIDYLERLLDRF